MSLRALGRPGRRAHLGVFGGPAAAAPQRGNAPALADRSRQAGTGHVSFDNRLPPTYPPRLALERAIRSALAGLPGRWDVIVKAPSAFTLVVAVVAPDASAWTCMMICKPEDLLPKAIADTVRAVCTRHR